MPLDVARRGTLDIKDPPLKAIVAANDNYEAGYHKGNAGGLDAIDTDLATGNIKNGITIFGKAGSADVLDVSDADAAVGDVKDPKTFYSVTGPRKTGTMPTVALAPGSSAYPAGYHAGDGGGLPAIDADLATGNIKFGITIFNIAGHTNVRDSSDADLTAAEAPTGKTFYAGGGAKKTGTGTQTLNPANENVPAGYYAATTLSAVDAQLAAANIKSGINIFGFVGAATVQDISDANALVGDVKDPKTFYSVTGARKTGTMATVTLAAGANAYPAGYHVGAASLTAVDGDLVTGSIKFGITIFGVAGHTNVRDVSDANALVGEVKDGRTFYAVGGAIKTGTMPTVAIVAANDNYPEGYHAGNVGGLDAIDADLAPANIKSGVTIFGKLGTYSPAPVYDDIDEVMNTVTSTTLDIANPGIQEISGISLGAEADWLTRTLTCAQATVIHAFAFCLVVIPQSVAEMTLRLYIDGNIVDTFVYSSGEYEKGMLGGYYNVSAGARIVKVTAYNSGTADNITLRGVGALGCFCPKI